MDLKNQILKRLYSAFSPDSDRIELETKDFVHFKLSIFSDKFESKTRIERSRMVYSLLQDLIGSNELHALQLILKTPQENGL